MFRAFINADMCGFQYAYIQTRTQTGKSVPSKWATIKSTMTEIYTGNTKKII